MFKLFKSELDDVEFKDPEVERELRAAERRRNIHSIIVYSSLIMALISLSLSIIRWF